MKKRTVLSAVAGFVLAGAMCMSFAACGSETAESIVGEEVDKATWEAALDLSSEAFDNFELKAELKVSEKMGDKEGNVHTLATCSYDSQKTYGKVNSETTASGFTDQELATLDFKVGKSEGEYYYDKTGESARYIVRQDGDWVEQPDPFGMVGRAAPSTSSPSESNLYMFWATNIMPDAKDAIWERLGHNVSYDDYEYSEEHKGYIQKESDEYNDQYYGVRGVLTVIKFKDGKLKAIFQECNNNVPVNDGTTTVGFSLMASLVISYGGQSVTIPDIS